MNSPSKSKEIAKTPLHHSAKCKETPFATYKAYIEQLDRTSDSFDHSNSINYRLDDSDFFDWTPVDSKK